jgi:hypothetical protein
MRQCNECACRLPRDGKPLVNSQRISFEKTTFPGIPHVAWILALPLSIRRSLFEDGVPRHFFYRGYYANTDLSVLRAAGHSVVVRFGSDSWGTLGVDGASGNVIHVRNGPGATETYVNATLSKFTDTARVLAEEFPYGTSGALEESHRAADRMRAIIRSVDSEAAARGSYWSDYPDEVDGWMYSLDEIAEYYRQKPSFLPVADSVDPRPSRTESSDDRLF